MYRNLLFFILIFLSSIHVTAQTNWDIIEIEKLCSLRFPNSMELRDLTTVQGKFISENVRKYTIRMGEMPGDVSYTLQPKGMNSSDPNIVRKATSSYARIIIKVFYGVDITQEMVSSLSSTDFIELDKMWMEEVKSYFPDAIWYKLKREYIGGKYALVSRYERPGAMGGSQVTVAEYKFFLKDKLFRVTASYRKSDANKWKADFEKFMSTLKFYE